MSELKLRPPVSFLHNSLQHFHDPSKFPADVHSLTALSSDSGGESGGAQMAGRPRQSIHMSSSRRRAVKGEKSLAGTVAVVAGATRGAGRGIARALGEAGATVYCTGRSVRGKRSPYDRPETIEETAEMISAAGGAAVAVRVDHTVEEEVEALFQRVERERGRLDVLVNSIAGEDPLMAQWCFFWKTDLKNAEAALRQSLLSHIITAKHAAPYMIRNRRGLIVEVTENEVLSAGGNPVTQTIKLALKGLALNMAAELGPHGVATVAVTPGFLRSETMLERFGVSEENWREGGKKDRNFLESESPLFVGRAVVALAGDPAILERSGELFSSWELGRKYRFTDADGRRPDWGASELDFSQHPDYLLQMMRDGSEIQLRWLSEVQRKTKHFLIQLPKTKAKAAGGTRAR
jgi:NAD(P)-dependent dehydrogenase (short-subunit alcohol dehydrogenase family)